MLKHSIFDTVDHAKYINYLFSNEIMFKNVYDVDVLCLIILLNGEINHDYILDTANEQIEKDDLCSKLFGIKLAPIP